MIINLFVDYFNRIFEMFLKRFDVFIDFEDSCSMATADKCTGAIPPGAYDAFNDTSLLEVTKKMARIAIVYQTIK